MTVFINNENLAVLYEGNGNVEQFVQLAQQLGVSLRFVSDDDKPEAFFLS